MLYRPLIFPSGIVQELPTFLLTSIFQIHVTHDPTAVLNSVMSLFSGSGI